MTADLTNQVTAGLLMLTLASVLLTGLMLTVFAIAYLKRARSFAVRPPRPKKTEARTGRVRLPVEMPSRWFAVRSTSIDAVADTLALHNATPCSWGEGMSVLCEHPLFISPPVKGWILIVGQALPDPSLDIDECFRFILNLSRGVGQVQFFAANRAVNHHAWVQADDGNIRRAYAWAGETVWNQGEVTDAEQELQMRCYDYGEGSELAVFPFEESTNSEKVGALAARWSVDPSSIDTSMLSAQTGLAGDLIHSGRY